MKKEKFIFRTNPDDFDSRKNLQKINLEKLTDSFNEKINLQKLFENIQKEKKIEIKISEKQITGNFWDELNADEKFFFREKLSAQNFPAKNAKIILKSEKILPKNLPKNLSKNEKWKKFILKIGEKEKTIFVTEKLLKKGFPKEIILKDLVEYFFKK